MKICENCNNEHDGTFGSGRFCCKKCSRAFSTKAKRKEINEKVSKKLKGRPSWNKNPKEKIVYIKICPHCKTEFISFKEHQIYCSRYCARKNNGSCESARKKISEKVQQRLKDRTFSGWKSRKDKTPSYAEQYFINLFNNENIVGWQRDYKAGRWFIDFAFLDKKIALEIDGKQHEERKEQDKIKDDFLSENGWKVFRIKWVNPTNDKNKEKLYNQIDTFKSLIL